jgi:hypothetical protein
VSIHARKGPDGLSLRGPRGPRPLPGLLRGPLGPSLLHDRGGLASRALASRMRPCDHARTEQTLSRIEGSPRYDRLPSEKRGIA